MSKYIWMINDFTAYKGASYIRGLTVTTISISGQWTIEVSFLQFHTRLGVLYFGICRFHPHLSELLNWHCCNRSVASASVKQLRWTWWRHQMETFSALLAICAGNSPVPGEFPAQRPVARSFDVFFDLHPNKRWSKQWWGWWFESPWCPLWRHGNEPKYSRKQTGQQ